MRWNGLLLWLLISLWAANVYAANDPSFDPATNPPTPQTYLRLANQIEAHLKTGVLAVWFPRCIDNEHGGFYPNFRENWSRGPNNDKFLVFQARMTWVTAQIAQRYPELSPQYRQWTLHGLDFLDKTLWDQQDGGFYWGLDENGKIKADWGTEKHVYGIGFGIYAASAVYATTKEPRALNLATRAFNWLDQHAHDNVNGGYYEALTRDGKPILKPNPATPDKKMDGIGTEYGLKSMNSHIHLLEALTELYRVWPNPVLKQRLQEMFLIVRDKIAAEPGYLNLYFTPDWKPVPDNDSFGHDV
ncbi:MAG: AGE family epimerase/isomerase, partial [Abitibacteriaceae bacterium]|nr:AGE family epimerase/isomerase [Abditibacteriaceae bacterium]